MSGKPCYIVLSPTPECLCLATVCRKEWDTLAISGRQLIVETLDKISQRPVERILVFQDRVEQPQPVRDCLKRLIATGTREIVWFAYQGGESVETACRGIAGVELIQAATLGLAVRKKFGVGDFGDLLKRADSLAAERRSRSGSPPSALVQASPAADSSLHDLGDFLRHKISLCFMQVMDPAPLVETVDLLHSACSGKPFRLAQLPLAERASVEHFRDADFPYLEGQTTPIKTLKRRIFQVAPTNLSVLILGETGTGKECVAFYLHELSLRRAKPFVALNCAGLDENLLRSELFGHYRGAFTGAISDKKGLVEAAEGGTLFLDEIGDMPFSIQADLLRFLQTRRFRPVGGTEEKRADLRIVAATQPGLAQRNAINGLRTDLYYRIAEVTLETPPLRKVPEDIRRVIRHIVYRHRLPDTQCEKALAYFGKGTEALERYSWPGNARELNSLVKRYLLLKDDVIQEVRELTQRETRTPQTHQTTISGQNSVASEPIRPIENLVADYVRQVNEQFRSAQSSEKISQKELAEKLGISVNTLKKYLGEKGMDVFS